MKELALTRAELEALVGSMALEVAGRQADSSATTEPQANKTIRAPEDRRRLQPGATDREAIPPSHDLARLARLFDHTLLRPDAGRTEIERLCDEALRLGCATVAINSVWISLAARKLRGSGVRAATVVGFPLGATLASAKRAEAEAAILAGTEEIDMVMNIGALRSGDFATVEADVRGVVEVCHAAGLLVKVILENAFLTGEQKVAACRVAKQAGADFVKTSTGLGPSGATAADVRLMREAVGPEMGVKAAGGIRSLSGALEMLQAGANRLGSSATVSILAEAAERTR